MRVLCVAEKNSIAKTVAQHLSGGARVENVPGITFVKNYSFDYQFPLPWGYSSVVFTSVAGHIFKKDFPEQYSNWQNCDPDSLFHAHIVKKLEERCSPIERNIRQQARYAQGLFIWTDCDREGEHIGGEIRDIVIKANPQIRVHRARFSNVERAHILRAARDLGTLDQKQVDAVEARMEIDLRTGAVFTRLLTLNLRPMFTEFPENNVISYGSCQFPTLGFVVDRYMQVKNFVSEPFWSIKVTHHKKDKKVTFSWNRNHLFDRVCVIILYERCLAARIARVTKMQRRPTSKWRPLPLTTVELQKNGSKYLRMNSSRVMKIAEDLYTKGWISYPRTETDQFDRGMDLRALVQKQTQDQTWGLFAQTLIAGEFQWPRCGRNNDKAHPPIHPVNYVVGLQLNEEERKVYEFVVRRFLACCSDDARGELTSVEIDYGGEQFHASGLLVLKRNYLEVYPYDKWVNTQELPEFVVGETFVPTEALMTDGKTTPPGYLTEPELIALMDANGIGTDATMAEHINTIKQRNYVQTEARGGSQGNGDNGESAQSGRDGRGRDRGRGNGSSRGGRGGRGAENAGRNRAGVEEFIPTTLGIALIEGYENLQFETSLSKPFLRKEMELQMKAICDGQRTRNDVVQHNLDQYRAVYLRTKDQMGVLRAAVRRHILGQNGS